MANINWPSGAVPGQTYTSPDGNTWTWTGDAWDADGSDLPGPIGPTGPIGVTGSQGPTGVGGTGGVSPKVLGSPYYLRTIGKAVYAPAGYTSGWVYGGINKLSDSSATSTNTYLPYAISYYNDSEELSGMSLSLTRLDHGAVTAGLHIDAGDVVKFDLMQYPGSTGITTGISIYSHTITFSTQFDPGDSISLPGTIQKTGGYRYGWLITQISYADEGNQSNLPMLITGSVTVQGTVGPTGPTGTPQTLAQTLVVGNTSGGSNIEVHDLFELTRGTTGGKLIFDDSKDNIIMRSGATAGFREIIIGNTGLDIIHDASISIYAGLGSEIDFLINGSSIMSVLEDRVTVGSSVVGTVATKPKLSVSDGFSGIGATGLPINTTLIVENNSTSYIGILSPDINNSGFYLGSPSDAFGTSLTWNYSTLKSTLASNVANGTWDIVVGNKNEASITIEGKVTSVGDRNSDFTLYGDLYLPQPTVPGTTGSTGSTGQMSWDSDYIYVCTGTNTWKRTQINNW